MSAVPTATRGSALPWHSTAAETPESAPGELGTNRSASSGSVHRNKAVAAGPQSDHEASDGPTGTRSAIIPSAKAIQPTRAAIARSFHGPWIGRLQSRRRTTPAPYRRLDDRADRHSEGTLLLSPAPSFRDGAEHPKCAAEPSDHRQRDLCLVEPNMAWQRLTAMGHSNARCAISVLMGCCLMAGCGAGPSASERPHTQAPKPSLEQSVRGYAELRLEGEYEAAYAHLSDRCEERTPIAGFMTGVSRATDLHEGAVVTEYEEHVDGRVAAVTYAMSAADIVRTDERWSRAPDGFWKYDDC